MSRPEEVAVPVELLLQLDSPELSARSAARDRLLDLVPPPDPDYTYDEAHEFFLATHPGADCGDGSNCDGQVTVARELLAKLHDAGYARLEKL